MQELNLDYFNSAFGNALSELPSRTHSTRFYDEPIAGGLALSLVDSNQKLKQATGAVAYSTGLGLGHRWLHLYNMYRLYRKTERLCRLVSAK